MSTYRFNQLEHPFILALKYLGDSSLLRTLSGDVLCETENDEKVYENIVYLTDTYKQGDVITCKNRDELRIILINTLNINENTVIRCPRSDNKNVYYVCIFSSNRHNKSKFKGQNCPFEMTWRTSQVSDSCEFTCVKLIPCHNHEKMTQESI